jgi:hypothetical protein
VTSRSGESGARPFGGESSTSDDAFHMLQREPRFAHIDAGGFVRLGGKESAGEGRGGGKGVVRWMAWALAPQPLLTFA